MAGELCCVIVKVSVHKCCDLSLIVISLDSAKDSEVGPVLIWSGGLSSAATRAPQNPSASTGRRAAVSAALSQQPGHVSSSGA